MFLAKGVPAGQRPGRLSNLVLSLAGSAVLLSAAGHAAEGEVNGWLAWRGPEQTGVSRETGLPDKVDPNAPLWVVDWPGQSAPVIAGDKLYSMGYTGEGPDLQEGISCFDAETGKLHWRQVYNDFLSDTIYLRYATASPAVDPETGNVYMQGTQGLLAGFTPDGKQLWQHSLMERLGRLTFPNARTASPLIDRDLVITRGITANWGATGPAADRFYAFDKKTGEIVWASTPSGPPRDNSFSHPQLGWYQGRRVIISAAGDGSVVCLNARTGEPLWRVPLFRAGINATVLVHNNDKFVAIFGTPYELGQMVAMRMPDVPPPPRGEGPVVLERAKLQLWEANISSSTSSPILVGDTIYTVAEKGDLHSVDVNTGKIHWSMKLGIEQRNSCPLFADGKLYVPILDDPATKGSGAGDSGTKGGFYIIKPTENEGQILCQVQVDGKCYGTPVAYHGKIYLQTAKKLYCWGKNEGSPAAPPIAQDEWPKAGQAAQLQIIPCEVLLHPGEKAKFRLRSLDENGFVVNENFPVSEATFASYVPPTARVKTAMNGSFNDAGELVASGEPIASAGAFEASAGNLKGYLRGRVFPSLPFEETFETLALTETNRSEKAAFAYPPLPWIGARFKFDVRERDGTKVLAKTVENKFFQRATVFIGTPEMHDYTIQADVLSDGNRRKMSEIGVINHRYLVVLKGNEQKIEVNSNQERLRISKDFKWSPNVWYTLKSTVVKNPDGGVIVRAKAWKRGEPEPEQWSIEVPHRTGHETGSPGLFGFSPQDMKVYIDNIKVTPNSKSLAAAAQ